MEKIEKDFDRDFYMSAQEAKDYGIVDEVIESLEDRKKDKDKD
jgi:ATP-dependent Clp protease protease subunit